MTKFLEKSLAEEVTELSKSTITSNFPTVILSKYIDQTEKEIFYGSVLQMAHREVLNTLILKDSHCMMEVSD